MLWIILTFWNGRIAPEVFRGNAILISAHGNSSGALLKHLEGISDEGMISITLPVASWYSWNWMRPCMLFGLSSSWVSKRLSVKEVEDQGKVGKQKNKVFPKCWLGIAAKKEWHAVCYRC